MADFGHVYLLLNFGLHVQFIEGMYLVGVCGVFLFRYHLLYLIVFGCEFMCFKTCRCYFCCGVIMESVTNSMLGLRIVVSCWLEVSG